MGLFLGCKDVNEFVDRATKEVLKKEKEKEGNGVNKGQRLSVGLGESILKEEYI